MDLLRGYVSYGLRANRDDAHDESEEIHWSAVQRYRGNSCVFPACDTILK